MKTKILTLIALFGLITSVFADDDTRLFQGGEFSLSLYGSWVDKDDSDVAPGADVNFFIFRHFGVGLGTFWENFDGSFFDNCAGEVIFRLPFEKLHLAPYGTLGAGYSFETEEGFGYFGAGVEFRFTHHFGIFGDVRWQVNEDSDDCVGLRLGVRVAF